MLHRFKLCPAKFHKDASAPLTGVGAGCEEVLCMGDTLVAKVTTQLGAQDERMGRMQVNSGVVWSPLLSVNRSSPCKSLWRHPFGCLFLLAE